MPFERAAIFIRNADFASARGVIGPLMATVYPRSAPANGAPPRSTGTAGFRAFVSRRPDGQRQLRGTEETDTRLRDVARRKSGPEERRRGDRVFAEELR